jgi:hypothetical protein
MSDHVGFVLHNVALGKVLSQCLDISRKFSLRRNYLCCGRPDNGSVAKLVKFSLYCWRHRFHSTVRYAEIFLPNRCLEAGCIIPLFHRCSARTTLKTRPHLLLRVGPCLQNCCMATRWWNLLEYCPQMNPTHILTPCSWNINFHLIWWRSTHSVSNITQFYRVYSYFHSSSWQTPVKLS